VSKMTGMVESAFLVNLQLVLCVAFYWSVKGKVFCETNDWKWLKVQFWKISSWSFDSHSIGLLRENSFVSKMYVSG